METQTAVNACNVSVFLDDEGGTPQDVSGSANRAELQFSNQIGEYQVFGGDWVKRLVCKRDATLTLQLVYTTGADEGWAIVRDWWNDNHSEARTIRLVIPENATGNDDVSGEFIISTMSVPADGTQSGPILVSLNLVQTGGVSIAAAA